MYHNKSIFNVSHKQDNRDWLQVIFSYAILEMRSLIYYASNWDFHFH